MRPEQERLAAGARAEVDDHVVAPRCDQHADQLAAFVLHFQPPVDDPRMRRHRRPPVDANAVRRVGRRDDREAFGCERRQCLVARCLHHVGAQVERRRRLPRACDCRARIVAVHVAESIPQPVRHVGGNGRRQRFVQARLERGEPFGVAGVDGRRELAHREVEVAHGDGERQVARQRALRKRFERALAPQVRERAVGDQRTIAGAHLAVSPKECIERRIGGDVELRDALDRAGEHRKLIAAQCHWPRRSRRGNAGIPLFGILKVVSSTVRGADSAVFAGVSSSRDGSDVRP